MKKISSLLFVLLLMLVSFTAGMQYPRGDVSQDGVVNVTDVSVLINYLLNNTWPDDPATETFTVGDVSFTMVTVEGGTFTMGAADDDTVAFDREKPAHEVTLSTFAIGQTPVTQALWMAVMGSNPSYFIAQYGYGEDFNRPVECVSWTDCQTFITKLNEMTGRNFRMLTEAEWEFAARGGNKSRGYLYAGSDNLDDVGWYWSNIPSQTGQSVGYGTQTVATKAPNELGLYDMSGNVCEWCQDLYQDHYNAEPQTNPTGPETGDKYVYRGGCWYQDPWNSRVTCRSFGPASSIGIYLGLRLAL